MFDYHMHSRLSYDCQADPREMVLAAARAGLQEICFTDHFDDIVEADCHPAYFTAEEYRENYRELPETPVEVRFGIEVGLLRGNRERLDAVIASYPFDFVIGSAHCSEEIDVYYPSFWEGKTVFQAERVFLEDTLDYVREHRNFDVLGHLNYISKSPCNPGNAPMRLEDHRELIAEIFRILIANGKGIEINTSGVDRCGEWLPSVECLKLFRDMGGKIVTVGSDAHTPNRVGQYVPGALDVLKEIFGCVYTFQGREPVRHRL